MEVKVIRTNRKTLAIQVYPDLSVIVRAPLCATDEEIERILKEKDSWIQKQLEQFRKTNAQSESLDIRPFTYDEIQKLANEALEYIPKRVEYFAKIIGVSYGRITIRNQKTRWGSASSKGNLNFNCFLMLAPLEVIDYVVVHELCHRKEMNHSKKFWSEVEKILPEYQKSEKWLKNEGSLIMSRF